jgi:hypothetical protein
MPHEILHFRFLPRFQVFGRLHGVTVVLDRSTRESNL